jgi:uncharacterized tellurite resistance protein B-like protein
MGWFIFFLICVVAYIMLNRKKADPFVVNKQENRNPSIESKFSEKIETAEHEDLANFRITVTTTSNRSRNETKNSTPGRWIPRNEVITIGSYKISQGFIYVGGKLDSVDGYNTDASLIDPSLPINNKAPDYRGDNMGYWPSYSGISAECRGAYLEWLSSNRNNPDEYIGYVFLYFYGLERRLLVDRKNGIVSNEEIILLFQEIKRLLSIYVKNNSFKNYAINLMSHIWIVCGAKGKVSDDILIYNNAYSPVFQFLLGKTVHEGKAISADLAFAWVKGNPDYRLKTPARRCPQEFRALFEKRYSERFSPDGFFVKPNKTKLLINYHPASASLRGYKPTETELPDPSRLKGPINKLCELVDCCIKELDAYSRFLGTPGNPHGSIKSLVLLPPDLIEKLNPPKLAEIKQFLNNNLVNGYCEISIESLLTVIGDNTLSKLTKKECEVIAKILKIIGFGIAPDLKYHGAKPEANGKVIIYPAGDENDFEPSHNFKQVGTILRLGAMVAKIDDNVSASEVDFLEKLVEQDSYLTDAEKTSLMAYLHWRLSDPLNIKGLKTNLSGISEKEKTAISHILISVARADGNVDPAEIKQLEKLYIAIGLDKNSVSSDVHFANARKHTASSEKTALSEIIPRKSNKDQTVIIDQELLRIHEEETLDVKNVLEAIFADTSIDEEDNTNENIINGLSNEDDILGLDDAHQTLYLKLITKEKWARDEIKTICEQLNLMIDGAFETINEWAFEKVNVQLIEDGDPVYIDIELAQEIQGIQSVSV